MICLLAWRRRIPGLIVPLMLWVAADAWAMEAGGAMSTPQATIQKVTDDVLAVLKTNKDKLRENPLEVTTLIARIVDPYFDYTLMSRAALGVAWRSADARQRESFTQVFHGLLITDYAAVFGQYTNQTITLTGTRWDDAAQKRATVMSQIISPGTQPIQVNYRVHFVSGAWQVYDITAEGVSLLINYRSVFTSELQRESLDTLISRLQKEVAAKKPTVTQ